PQLYLADASGRELDASADVIDHAIELLLNGRILAIKDVGGFHLACNATDAGAGQRLRLKKFCGGKPFPLMAGAIESIEKYLFIAEGERELLISAARPIVLLDRNPGLCLPDAIAPRLNSLGFMLPYAPLHHLLLNQLDSPLVMTSGNLSDEPICYDNRD